MDLLTPKEREPLVCGAWPMCVILMSLGFAVGLAAIYFFARLPTSRRTKLIGRPAPVLKFELPKGTPVSLENFRGKAILLNFWASWCAPCIEEMPSLRELELLLGPKGFVLLAINTSNEKPGVLKLLPKGGVPENLVFDVSFDNLTAYEIDFIPLSVLIDSAGTIRKIYSGPRNWIRASVVREIEAFLE